VGAAGVRNKTQRSCKLWYYEQESRKGNRRFCRR
jgi:hypothetical protein